MTESVMGFSNGAIPITELRWEPTGPYRVRGNTGSVIFETDDRDAAEEYGRVHGLRVEAKTVPKGYKWFQIQPGAAS